jgi:hypothetical protein
VPVVLPRSCDPRASGLDAADSAPRAQRLTASVLAWYVSRVEYPVSPPVRKLWLAGMDCLDRDFIRADPISSQRGCPAEDSR